MSSREVYEIAITRPAGVSVGDMQRYIKSAIEYTASTSGKANRFHNVADDVRVHRQAPDRKFWINPDDRLPAAGKHVFIKYTNGITAKAYVETTDPSHEKVKWYEWVNAETGRKIPRNTVQAWMS